MGLDGEECREVCPYLIDRSGLAYDLKNIIDLARYLLPVPASWRWQVLEPGSGDPTRAICSALIAQAYPSVRYPIFPHMSCAKMWTKNRDMHCVRFCISATTACLSRVILIYLRTFVLSNPRWIKDSIIAC